ncbi:MAG TPA: cbb3-type cytochrome c oxidase N-terminal domain-containing protein [Saprospiraceae bacterium]|nr:cbb3-type cytochrome c oxidase N-terminal domain-containing protein [Saprospiraceae bacterium]
MTSKKYLPTLLIILVSLTTGWAQTATATAATTPAADQLPNIMTTAFFICTALVFAVSLLALLRANSMLTKRLMINEAERHGIQLPADAINTLQPVQDDIFTRLRKKYWEDPIPQEREGDITLDHNYDGIRELDNHLPPWWVNMFILTIIWAVGYMYFYHWGGSGPSQQQEYENSLEKAKKEIAVALAGKAEVVDESNVAALTDAGAIADGEQIFKNVCAACHGQKGEGTVGPNLTDDHWLHGGGIKNVFKTIKYGVPEKGMIAWSAQLKPSDMQKVASYILTLHGTNPPNPKAPQGEVWKEEGAAKDTTATPAAPAGKS